jgi:hypothetical protein
MLGFSSVAVLTAISAAFALAALMVSSSAAVAGKRTDVLIDSHKRFDALMVARGDLLRRLRCLATSPGIEGCATPGDALADEARMALDIELELWAQRFWSLQFDQFLWWRKGFVARDVFRYWLLSRRHEFRQAQGPTDPELARWRHAVYERGWQNVRHAWTADRKWRFVMCMDLVRFDCVDEAVTISAPAWWARLWSA